MALTFTYRYYCATEDDYIMEDLLDSADIPDECTNDAGHTVDWDSLAIIKEVIS